jgi:hypothetical protein
LPVSEKKAITIGFVIIFRWCLPRLFRWLPLGLLHNIVGKVPGIHVKKYITDHFLRALTPFSIICFIPGSPPTSKK